MTHLDKVCHKLMDSNHELKAKCGLLEKENEQLIREKERYKTLHAIAHEQMDNRILTIKNFVEECSDDKVKRALEKLLWTEVLDYDVSAKNRALIDENEQLTKELKVYRKLARCSNCEHHGYDWFDDGEEFEVCRKGNDVTKRICEDWEEL